MDTLTSAWIVPGDVVEVSGVEYVVIEKRRTRYLIARLSDGAKFTHPLEGITATRRDYAALQDILERHESEAASVKMGDVVRLIEGKFKGTVGVVATVSAKSYILAVPGQPSIRVGTGAKTEPASL